MNKNAEAWVEALRSGEYSQTRGVLHDKDGFCCLGVACDLAGKSGLKLDVISEYDLEENDITYEYYSYDGIRTVLPLRVQEWLGISSDMGSFLLPIPARSGEHNCSLTGANDEIKLTFTQIADLVEWFQEELFND